MVTAELWVLIDQFQEIARAVDGRSTAELRREVGRDTKGVQQRDVLVREEEDAVKAFTRLGDRIIRRG